ncbi:MAG TPA: prolyl oligopeptidase family serine peptidase [Thermoanaerobaculia bacterium]|nr:prolyl oligopeptidase family serine peptidase [Thermoanaerobaculia bacterium]
MPRTFSLVLVLFFFALEISAQDVDAYRMPPPEIAALADAPLTPSALVSPTGDTVALLEVPPLLTLGDLAQPELKLAGLRFNPVTLDQTRPTYYRNLRLLSVAGAKVQSVTGLPADARIRNAAWSPDGKSLAFTFAREGGVELWAVDVSTRVARRVGTVLLNNVSPKRPYEWLSESTTLAVRAVPITPRTRPVVSAVADGPVIQQNLGKKTPARTYPDLLQNPADAALFEHHLESQPMLVTLDGKATPVGAMAPITRFEPSPDGRYLLVETVRRPFSYTLPESRFPRRLEVWDRSGSIVRQLADLPLADSIPTDFSAAAEGPRDAGWRDDKPASVFWVEAQDKGDPRVAAAVRDRLYALDAPFTATATKLAELALRFDSVLWGRDDLALVSEDWFKDRKTRTWRIDPSKPDKSAQLIFERSFEDRYSDPGTPALHANRWGRKVLLTADGGRSILLIGEGASSEGDRPFLDRMNLETRKSNRLWQSGAPDFEFVVEVLDGDATRMITRRESINDPPNYFLRELGKKRVVALTNFPHPTPQLAKASKELIRYKRADGLQLSGTLYLPPGYDPKSGPLPVLLWAYPQEFKTASAAAQVTDSPYRFIRAPALGPLPFLARGYAVLDDPSIPIIGEGTAEPNDTYIEQLVAGAKAAVDELVRRGVGDRDRMAIGGHSYGAFMTANLLAHSTLFRAGIARSGAYNRTLTPFSFQAEERTFWEAPDTYIKMSPFTYAQNIKTPLLMIHGMEDSNSGTFPIQSERLYAALKGHGATVRMVMLPYESHGYRARESVMHMLWEMDTWLDRYVKNAAAK